MGSVTTDPAKMDAVFNGGRFGTAEKQKKKDADEKLWVTELQGWTCEWCDTRENFTLKMGKTEQKNWNFE